MRHVVLVCTILLCAAWCAVADTSNTSIAADQAYSAKQWPQASHLYQQLSTEQPGNALWWLRLGDSYRHVGNYDGARQALAEAEHRGYQPMVVKMFQAMTEAAAGNNDKALALIDELGDAGFPAYRTLDEDDAFASLKSSPRFLAARQKMMLAAEPCKHPEANPEYRQFDYWVGDWDVYNKFGAPSGHNRVRLILGDCVVEENWASRLGGEGKSFSKYNPHSRRWEQYWVDDQGDTTFFHGKLEGTNLVFHSETTDSDGTTTMRRLTFFRLGPDKVRQFSEMSMDGGKTWSPEYDLTYIRHTATAKNLL
jgi:hypothetical protein